jgi:hypothetical protein
VSGGNSTQNFGFNFCSVVNIKVAFQLYIVQWCTLFSLSLAQWTARRLQTTRLAAEQTVTFFAAFSRREIKHADRVLRLVCSSCQQLELKYFTTSKGNLLLIFRARFKIVSQPFVVPLHGRRKVAI